MRGRVRGVFCPFLSPRFPGSPHTTLRFLEFSPEGCAPLLRSPELVPIRALSHNGALSPDVPAGLRSEPVSCAGASRDGGRAGAWQAARGDGRGGPAAQKSPCPRRQRQQPNANAGQERTAPALLENANSPPNRAQGRKWKPRQGRRTCAARASWRPTPLGPSKGADAPPWVCPFLSAKLIRNLCRSAFPPHFFFFFFFSSDPRTEPRNPKTELQASELVHHRRRRSDVDLGDKRLPTVVRDSSRARPERLCDSLQSTQNYSSQSSKVLNVPP